MMYYHPCCRSWAELVLTDSPGKYIKVPGAKVKAYSGETLARLVDRMRKWMPSDLFMSHLATQL